MSPLDLLRFSAGALRGHRLRTGLSLLGVAIGVASVILLTSLGEGARLYVTGEFSSMGSNLLIVLPGKTETTGGPPVLGGSANDVTLADADALARRIPTVRNVAPLIAGTATARAGERAREVVVAGTTPAMRQVRKIRLRTGAYLPEGDAERSARVAVLGTKVADELFPGRSPLGELVRIGDERYRVIGVMAPRGVSMGENLDEIVHIPVAAAMKLFNRRGLFRVVVEATSFEAVEATKAAMLKVFVERHDGVEDVTVLTQDAVMAAFSRILTILTAALGGIAAVSLSVAGIGIMNVMLVSVSERVREIGLLKAVGVTRGQVLAAFLVEAVILSASGGLVGLAVGFLSGRVLKTVYPAFPIHAPGWAVAGALALSAVVGVAFGALPARRAAGLDPVAALARR